ncbi:hypothetical protein [Methylorubrum thiocyanatum]|uniref:hypothetical protein n=1 Tax=Methylorubrum thiocyanatum TaxID=47958 RepID=UPI0035C81F97
MHSEDEASKDGASKDGSGPGFAVRRLGPGDIPSMRALNAPFGLADRLGTREEVLHFDLPVGARPLP